MLLDPALPGRDPLLHLGVALRLGKGVPRLHFSAVLVAEENSEVGVVRAHSFLLSSADIGNQAPLDNSTGVVIGRLALGEPRRLRLRIRGTRREHLSRASLPV